MSQKQTSTPSAAPRPPRTFSGDFRRFFQRGLATLLPTLITLWLLIWLWTTLWESLGQHIITGIVWLWNLLIRWDLLPFQPQIYTTQFWYRRVPEWGQQIIGNGLAILLVYIVGLLIGNLIGRSIWRLAEMLVMRVPLVRAIYPAVKQVTDFLLAERSAQFQGSRVVAVKPHSSGIWSVGLVTGTGLKPLSETLGEDMVTVFIPSSPTAFSGYVVVVPRAEMVELPMTVEEALRLLVSGGVLTPPTAPAGIPGKDQPALAASAATTPAAAPSNPAPTPSPAPSMRGT